MELNFAEIDSKKSFESFDYNSYEMDTSNNSDKYWEQNTPANQNAQTSAKKKKVSFDDILSNMNLVVNKNGVLQFMSQTQNQTQQSQYLPQQHPYPPQQNQYSPQQNQYSPHQNQYSPHQNQYSPHQNQYSPHQNQYSPQQQKQSTKSVQIKNEPLDPSVKHSYIYNKYFKDYQDAYSPVPEVKIPKTREEYLKMLVEEKLRKIEERKRISQIKSTKLLFTTNVGNIKASKNGLRMMSFY
jgi:hypothetical protein